MNKQVCLFHFPVLLFLFACNNSNNPSSNEKAAQATADNVSQKNSWKLMHLLGHRIPACIPEELARMYSVTGAL